MPKINVRLPKLYLDKIDELVKESDNPFSKSLGYPTRSDFIRIAVSHMLKHEGKLPDFEVKTN
jgi:Arc/MetJ-type ribon-helix-helix transcriptional regulator